MKKLVILLLVLAMAGGAGYWYVFARGQRTTAFRTAKVERGKFYAAIGATGTVEPLEVIDVGAQVNGRVERFGIDPQFQNVPDTLRFIGSRPYPGASLALAVAEVVLTKGPVIDYNSSVEVGTVLAQLDDSLFQTRVASARADLARAEADLAQKKAVMELAAADMLRAQQLLASKANAQADFDVARATHLTAKANVKVGEAAIEQAKSALKETEINLGYTTIRSTVKGVIIDRRVNIGQTVVSSLTAPSLFLIAKDLKRVQVWASVNEADLGSIMVGQAVTFTVDARPGKVFEGTVAQIRLNATMTSNVVTYTVVVNTDNSSLTLMPYLTANVQFEVTKKDNALLVPNAALRWRPQMNQVLPEKQEWFARTFKKDAKASPPSVSSDKGKQEISVVWVADGEYVRPIVVKAGFTDGTVTEILGGDLSEDMEVIIREDRQENGGPTGASPFTPSMFGGKKKE